MKPELGRIAVLTLVCGSLFAQDPLFREEALLDAQFDAEVFATGLYMAAPIHQLSGRSDPNIGEMFNVARARLSSYITIDDRFTLGIGGQFNNILSGNPSKLPILLSEAFVQADTFNFPLGMAAVFRFGRFVANYGDGLLVSDFHGFGYNGGRLSLIPSPEWDYWIDIYNFKIAEAGAFQTDTTFFPVQVSLADTEYYHWLYTKYDLDAIGIIAGKLRGESTYNGYLGYHMLLEDRGLTRGFRPQWFNGFIEVGPIGGFNMSGELGWLFGRWDAEPPIYYDLSDQLWQLLQQIGTGTNGFGFSAFAFDVKAYYEATDMFTFGAAYYLFSGDDGSTPDIYEGWFPPTLRSTVSPNADWIHWTGFGDVMTWNAKPGMYRSFFFMNPTDMTVINGSIIMKAFPIQYSLVGRVDFYAFLEYWTPPGVDDYIGTEIDISLKGSYADIADVGATFGYLMPGTRLKKDANGVGGWPKPTPIDVIGQPADWDASSEHTQNLWFSSGGSFMVRLWVYRHITF